MISSKKPLISEPKVLVTGVEGAGKTLFAVQQADLLAQQDGGDIFQLNIRGADPGHLPKLPFEIKDLAYNEGGTPMLDPQTGEHMAMWATLPPGSVIIVDEAHKVFPQRGPGRPPRHIEMMAEGRQAGVRFVLLSQSPDSIDGFLRDRIHRHYHLERKGNAERATVFEFDHCVYKPRTAWQERKDAQVHFWSFPKQYYGWWTSAKSHSFKLRIPWKIWAALVFVPIAAYVAWQVFTNVGGVMDGVSAVASDSSPRTESLRSERLLPSDRGEDRRKVLVDPEQYIKQFQPVVPVLPWSAPAYQMQDVSVKPDLYCISSGTDGADGCKCFTEQMTPYQVPDVTCKHFARHGVYNPYRAPLNTATRDRDKPGEARQGPSGVRGPVTAVIPATPQLQAPAPGPDVSAGVESAGGVL